MKMATLEEDESLDMSRALANSRLTKAEDDLRRTLTYGTKRSLEERDIFRVESIAKRANTRQTDRRVIEIESDTEDEIGIESETGG